MKHVIELSGNKIFYRIKKSRRGTRSMRMTIGLDGVVVVTVPHVFMERFVEKFIRQKASWIFKNLKTIQGKTIIKHSKNDYKKNKDAILQHVKERLVFFNTFYKFPYHRISIRNQTSLWGSCTRYGNLQFNYKLMYLPKRSFDYVIVHELCHLKEHNHSERFWLLVQKMIPDYKVIRRTLRNYVMKEG